MRLSGYAVTTGVMGRMFSLTIALTRMATSTTTGARIRTSILTRGEPVLCEHPPIEVIAPTGGAIRQLDITGDGSGLRPHPIVPVAVG